MLRKIRRGQRTRQHDLAGGESLARSGALGRHGGARDESVGGVLGASMDADDVEASVLAERREARTGGAEHGHGGLGRALEGLVLVRGRRQLPVQRVDALELIAVHGRIGQLLVDDRRRAKALQVRRDQARDLGEHGLLDVVEGSAPSKVERTDALIHHGEGRVHHALETGFDHPRGLDAVGAL